MKEDGRSVQGPGISPSNEGGEGYFFTKPPPLNPREGPTQEEIERSMTIKGPLGEKGAVSIPVATGIIGLVLGAGGVLLYQEVFAAEKSENIDSFPNSFNPADGPRLVETKEVKPEEVFDNTAIKGVIKPSMIVRLPQEEIDRQFPSAFGKLREDSRTIVTISQGVSKEIKDMRPDVTFSDLLFEVGPDKNTLQFQYPLDLRPSSNPNAKIQFKKSYSAFTQTDYDAFKNEGYYDTYDFYNIPKETIIRMPVGGYLVRNIEGEVFMYFKAPNGNTYSLQMVGTTENRVVSLKPLVDVPIRIPEFNGKPIGTIGYFAPTGKPAFQTTEKLDELSFRILSAVKAKGEPVQAGNVTSETVYLPTNIELFRSPDKQLLGPLEK